MARIGGDEFVVILPVMLTVQDGWQVAEKIRTALECPFNIDGHEINISSSIGGAIYPDHGMDENQLMQYADQAMYQAKNGGRNAIQFYR